MARIGAIAAAVALVLGAGCGGGGRVARENERLREREIELEQQVEDLTRRVRELEAGLREAAAAASPEAADPEVLEATPAVVDLSIGRLSHARDDDEDGRADRILVYVRPTDAQGRFVQLVGRLSVRAMVFAGEADPVVLAGVDLDPLEVRAAYRSSPMGTHYSVILPLEPGAADAAAETLLHALFTDGRTGLEHSAERTIELAP